MPGDGHVDSIRAMVDDPVQGMPSNETTTRKALTDPQATMKIIELTYDATFGMPDFGEADLVQLLTGWNPVVYSTQPTFKDQELVIKLLEELQKVTTPNIEFESTDDEGDVSGSSSDSGPKLNPIKKGMKREKSFHSAPKPNLSPICDQNSHSQSTSAVGQKLKTSKGIRTPISSRMPSDVPHRYPWREPSVD